MADGCVTQYGGVSSTLGYTAPLLLPPVFLRALNVPLQDDILPSILGTGLSGKVAAITLNTIVHITI